MCPPSGDAMPSTRSGGMYLTFSTANQEAVTVRLGLSYTSIENARVEPANGSRNIKQ